MRVAYIHDDVRVMCDLGDQEVQREVDRQQPSWRLPRRAVVTVVGVLRGVCVAVEAVDARPCRGLKAIRGPLACVIH